MGGSLKAKRAALVLLVCIFFSAGCAAKDPGTASETSSPRPDPGALKTTQVAPKTTPEKTTATAARTKKDKDKKKSEDYCINRQFAKATQGMTRAQKAAYENDVMGEAVQRGVDPRAVLKERGYPC